VAVAVTVVPGSPMCATSSAPPSVTGACLAMWPTASGCPRSARRERPSRFRPPTKWWALGHSSAAITLATYSHLWPDANDRTRRAAGELLKASSGPLRTHCGLRANLRL
jgi:hypothetical protein